ncbi:MAG: cell wall-binding repeat-containing protein [Candidatus Syntrophonatronum acetioxidans]|uniref:Cell wall-binding repeat-containing protein n=1 Tax=Candidatus Syntrophonatronum acetioxidans TaxID=1795816 RepID=A0A424YCH4_9FIRM|nr:MAG: cell wall-binding repeat-containing protein [Candidatus Syntrophonatronum acetioxidans]
MKGARKVKMKRPLSLMTLLALALALTLLAGTGFAADGQVERTWGADRYETSVEIAKERYPQGTDTLIIARGDAEGGYADGLAGSLLSEILDAPLLLTRPQSLPTSVQEAVRDLEARETVILGGTTAVSLQVEMALEELVGEGNVERIAGQDRYETAALIAEKALETGEMADHAFMVNGHAPADSLVAGAAAYRDKAPILLVGRDRIPGTTEEVIEELGLESLYLVGGTGVISQEVALDLEELAPVEKRLAGEDRYDTSVEFAREMFPDHYHFSLVRGEDASLADAVGVAVLGNPVLYVEKDQVPTSVYNYLNEILLPVSQVRVIGGPAAVGEGVIETLTSIIKAAQGVHFDEAGTYGPEPEEDPEIIEDYVTISAPGVTLRNTVIEGDLYITEGVGDGEVHLDNVTVEGDTYVYGGGPDSVLFEDSELGLVVVEDPQGKVRVIFENTKVEVKVEIRSGSLIVVEGDYEIEVSIETSQEVTLEGDFAEVFVNCPQARVTLAEGSTVEDLIIEEGAQGTELLVESGAQVKNLYINGEDSQIKGEGTIDYAEIEAPGAELEIVPEYFSIGEDIEAIIDGEEKSKEDEVLPPDPPVRPDPRPRPSPTPSPRINSATFMVGEEVVPVEGLPGLRGTIDLRDFDDLSYLVGGTITANRTGTIEITSLLDDQGENFLNLLPEGEARTQSVSSHREEELDLIGYLQEWGEMMDPQPGDPETGVSLYILREFFGESVTVEGDLAGRQVTLEINLGPHQDQ